MELFITLINERNQKLKNGMSTEVIDDVLIKIIDSKPKEKKEKKKRETR